MAKKKKKKKPGINLGQPAKKGRKKRKKNQRRFCNKKCSQNVVGWTDAQTTQLIKKICYRVKTSVGGSLLLNEESLVPIPKTKSDQYQLQVEFHDT